MKKNIAIERLIPMDIFCSTEPITIDIVYAKANHPRNIFKTALYQPNARLWAQYDMARIIILTARILNKKAQTTLELKDCLRTVDTQAAMQETPIVKAHPEWMKEPNRLLAPPGHGGHPRGMAIDVCVYDKNGFMLDMGTEFDEMTAQSARAYTDFPQTVLTNRALLETSFLEAANQLGHTLLPIPSEWWDFRFFPAIYDQYTPLADTDLPPQMQMTTRVQNSLPDFPDNHFQDLKNTILQSLN